MTLTIQNIISVRLERSRFFWDIHTDHAMKSLLINAMTTFLILFIYFSFRKNNKTQNRSMFRKLNKNKKKNKIFRSSASKQEENPKPVINNVFSEEQTANNNDRINNKDDIDGNASDDDTGTTELLDLIRRENTSKGKKRMRGGDHDNGADGGVVVGNEKNNTNKNNAKDGSVVHSYGLSDPSSERAISGKDMATRSAEHHPLENEKKEVKGKDNGGDDDGGNDKKIYKGMDTKRNKFLAGPLKAPTFVRTTCRFDYQVSYY